ncbi:hypothetical protein [uncultured Tateyamaria sp.]|uniref:hypothetical protein n=1 Tax=uncultured Tateyamaria sp. TaxID=455651 RepID=UPI002637A7F1|nr:hypothetical protein [uncultured Tateyamaria sp.]
MEQNQCAPQHRSTSDTPSVLLAGFPNDEAERVVAALEQMGWASIVLNNELDIEVAFGTMRFDITVIDAEHLEVFAPHFIARLRGTQGPSSDATIIAVDNSAFAGFKEQLAEAGADLVVPKPSDPKSLTTDTLGQMLQCALANVPFDEGARF